MPYKIIRNQITIFVCSIFKKTLFTLLIKRIFNVYLIKLFYSYGVAPYYGVITSSILGYLVSISICIYIISHKYNVNFEKTMKNMVDVVVGIVIMLVVLFIVYLVVPIYSDNRIVCLGIIVIYALFGAVTYLLYTYKSKTIKNIFGNKLEKLFIKKSN